MTFPENDTTYAHRFLPGVYAEVHGIVGTTVKFYRVDTKNREYRVTGYLGNFGQVVRNKVRDGGLYFCNSVWSAERFLKFFQETPARVKF